VFSHPGQRYDDIRGVLDAGHKYDGTVVRCVNVAGEPVPESYPVFAPVALAGLGQLPATLADRSVVIEMLKRRADEPVERFVRRQAEEVAYTIRCQLQDWAKEVGGSLPALPLALPAGIDDRDADVWGPLVVVADAAGGCWPDMAREAATAFVRRRREEPPSVGVQLLADCRSVFEGAKMKPLASVQLIAGLRSLQHGWNLDPQRLARRLRPFGIHPVMLGTGSRGRRGYRPVDFADAWSRYVPEPATPATSDVGGGSAPAGHDAPCAD
jgi:hypothetical protein